MSEKVVQEDQCHPYPPPVTEDQARHFSEGELNVVLSEAFVGQTSVVKKCQNQLKAERDYSGKVAEELIRVSEELNK